MSVVTTYSPVVWPRLKSETRYFTAFMVENGLKMMRFGKFSKDF